MLVETPQEGSVISLLLLTGQEIIGKFQGRTDTETALMTPLAPDNVQDPNDPNKTQLVFRPVMATAVPDKALSFENDKIISTGKTNPQFEKAYLDAIASMNKPKTTAIIT